MATLNAENLLNTVESVSAANTAKSQEMAREQMKFNAEQAAISRTWQENMSNTSHQREVKDLIAAGLNPVLSANNGASTPSGSTAQGTSGKVDTSYAQALASYATTLINSATQITASQIAAGASKYASDNSLAGTVFSANTGYQSSVYSADKSYAGKVDTSDNANGIIHSIINHFKNGDVNFSSKTIKPSYKSSKNFYK